MLFHRLRDSPQPRLNKAGTVLCSEAAVAVAIDKALDQLHGHAATEVFVPEVSRNLRWSRTLEARFELAFTTAVGPVRDTIDALGSSAVAIAAATTLDAPTTYRAIEGLFTQL